MNNTKIKEANNILQDALYFVDVNGLNDCMNLKLYDCCYNSEKLKGYLSDNDYRIFCMGDNSDTLFTEFCEWYFNMLQEDVSFWVGGSFFDYVEYIGRTSSFFFKSDNIEFDYKTGVGDLLASLYNGYWPEDIYNALNEKGGFENNTDLEECEGLIQYITEEFYSDLLRDTKDMLMVKRLVCGMMKDQIEEYACFIQSSFDCYPSKYGILKL